MAKKKIGQLAIDACLALEADARRILRDSESQPESFSDRWQRGIEQAKLVVAACDAYHAANPKPIAQ